MRRALPWIMFLAMQITLISLGVWQLQRKEWKEALIQKIESNVHAPLMKIDTLQTVSPKNDFRLAKIECQPALKSYVTIAEFGPNSELGERAYFPCMLESGGAIVVRDAWLAIGIDTILVTSVGPDKWNSLRKTESYTGRIRFWSDASLAQRLGNIRVLGPKDFKIPVAPFYLDTEGRQPAPPNNHFAYAMQWFIFAGVLLVIFTIWMRRQRLAPPGAGA